MTEAQKEAFNKVIALRNLADDTKISTTRSQGAVLKKLNEDDLAIVALHLEEWANNREE